MMSFGKHKASRLAPDLPKIGDSPPPDGADSSRLERIRSSTW
jgi:hypothetical protein